MCFSGVSSVCRCQPETFLPVSGWLLIYLLPSLFKQQHSLFCLVQQISDMDPQVGGLISASQLAASRPGTSVGVPNQCEHRFCLRYQVWQIWWTVPQAKPGLSAQFVELSKSFQGLVHQPPVSTGRGLRAQSWTLRRSWTCCRHHFADVCLKLNQNHLKCQSVYVWGRDNK